MLCWQCKNDGIPIEMCELDLKYPTLVTFSCMESAIKKN